MNQRLSGLARVWLGGVLVVVAAAPQIPALAQDLSPHREFALHNPGKAESGKELFESHQKLVCTNCHRITGLEKSGPNLDGIGDKYKREELIRQILDPSHSIKPGYEQAVIVTTDGKVLTGRIERTTRIETRLIDSEGKQTKLLAEEIEELQYSDKSLMPDDVAATLSQEQFADLVAYLQSLTFGIKTGLTAGGRSVPVAYLKHPVTFTAIHPQSLAFRSPVWCGALPGRPGQLLVIEHQQSKVWRYIRDSRSPRKELFLDLSGETHISPNQGVMGLAFHPDYPDNGRYFVEYEVREEGRVKTTVAERRASEDRLSDSGDPSIRLLEVEQPAFNHNGGCIDFGPDGMLYAAFGDGGPQKDPPGYSQNPRVLLGSMVRIDVDHKDDGKPYAIPPDNPYVAAQKDDPDIRPETWAIGFREPWRFSFDSLTGELYVGDVGQNKFEEVCLVSRGDNHGWNVFEAYAPFSDEYHRDGETYTEPLFAYEHGLGFSITSGYVYRANPESSFYGVYIFGDFNTRRVWGLRQRDGELLDVRELGTAPGGIASFGLDDRGELLLVTYGGTIYHVDLSETEFGVVNSAP